MTLPELGLQALYGQFAWTVVLATLIGVLWPRRWGTARTRLPWWIALAATLQALPHEFAPGYWLSLAFHYPSGLLVGLCALRLFAAVAQEPAVPVMPSPLAAALALAGALLYVDAMGFTALGLYYTGFGPDGAPLVALAAMAACTVAVWRGWARAPAAAMLCALAAFAILRLPTGNLWDALLDPLLWGWALVTLAARGRAAGALRRGSRGANDKTHLST